MLKVKEMLFPLFKEKGWTPTSSTGHVSFFALGLAFLVAEQSLEWYLMSRQRQCLKDKEEAPESLIEEASKIDQNLGAKETEAGKSFVQTIKNKFSKSRDYSLDKNWFGFASSALHSIVSFGGLLLGRSPLLLTFSKTVLNCSSEFSIAIAMSTCDSLLHLLIDIPLSYYSTFVVEQQHGFNNTSSATFWTDKLKNLCIMKAIEIPITWIMIKVVHWAGKTFYFHLWLFLVAFSLVMMSVYPNLIMPLFNKYTPLDPDSPLRRKINDLAKQLEYPLTKIFEVDGSKRSSHSNAYLYGFFKDKRIVLFDTLFKNKKNEDAVDKDELDLCCTDEEVVGILAHELGHWKLNHTVKGFVVQQSVMFVILFLSSKIIYSDTLYNQFGIIKLEETGKYPVSVGLSLCAMMLSPISSLIGFAANFMSRKFEYEADAFAVSLGKVNELKTGLMKITVSNLSAFEVDPYYHMFTHSHPTLLQRLQRMDLEAKKLK